MARIKHVPTPSKRGSKRVKRAKSQSPATRSTRRSQEEEPATPETRRQKKKRHYRPGTLALREIRHFQRTVKLVIPAAPFIRCVKQITHQLSTEVSRWTAEALLGLQEAAEDYLVHLFEDGMLCAIHAKRVTLMKKDFELARRLGGIGRPW